MAIDNSVQAVFDKAMYLIDAQHEGSGHTVSTDTQEYRVRTLGILNSLIDEVYPYSANGGKRPAPEDLRSFGDTPDLDAMLLRHVLPCGLAARLLSEENPALANYFQQLYEEGLQRAMRRPAEFAPVAVPYGGIEHAQFGSW